MKLLLQVLFTQGYLWRMRCPEEFGGVSSEKWHPNVWNVAYAAALVSMGALSIYYGSLIFGPLLLFTGIAFVVWAADFFGLNKIVGSRAFWTSVSWACGALTIGGFMLLLVLSIAWQSRLLIDGSVSLGLGFLLLFSSSFMAFYGSMVLHAFECRYLYFADPIGSGAMLDEPDWSPRELWVDTYRHLPRQILFGVEPPRPVGGSV